MTPINRCLDGETLAAWVDGGLTRNDAAMAEAHVSTCPRCQEIAGLIVKTTPAAIADPPWWRRRAAWLIPATVGVTAAGLLMIVPADPTPGPAAPTVTAPSVTTPSVTTPPVTAARESAQKAAAPAAPPLAPPAEARPAEPTRAEMKKERQREERTTAADQAAAPAAAPAPSAAGQLARQSFALADKHAVSPDGKLQWRITDPGAVERSSDGGTTWQAMNIGVTATFTTVQAPEPRTALVKTSDGRTFQTTDGGTTWQLVAPKF